MISKMREVYDLLKEYESAKKEDLDTRSIIVLELIEHAITYPPLERISEKDLSKIDKYVKQLVEDLRRDKQYLFSVRISKIWKKRVHLCELAKIWHEVQDDYMDNLEYHEEVKWLRSERKRLIKK